MSRIPHIVRLATLAAIVPLSAALGATLDELDHFGFTTWQSACRAAGFSAGSWVHFTLELLPLAVIGALCGGLILQLLALRFRHEPQGAASCLAVHLGCVLTMPIGLLLCALAWPVPVMLLADVALAIAAASLLVRLLIIRSAAYTHARCPKREFSCR